MLEEGTSEGRKAYMYRYSRLNNACPFFIVYNKGGYVDLVSKQAEASMVKAIKEVQALPNYASKEKQVGPLSYFCSVAK